MYQLRILIVAAVLWVIFLFGLARPDLIGVELSPAVYVLTLGIVLAVFFLPDLGVWHWAVITAPTVAIYLGAGLFGGLNHALSDWPVVSIELIVLLITVFLARTTSLIVAKLEHVLESLVVDANSTRILSPADGEETINSELFRARRFDRPVAFALLKLGDVPELRNAPTDRFDIHAVLQRSYLRSRVGQLVESVLYRTDPLAWFDDNLVLCLPETTKPEAEKLAQQIYDLVRMMLNIRIPIGISTFPENGLIYSDLVEAASKNLCQFMEAKVQKKVAEKQSASQASPANMDEGATSGKLALDFSNVSMGNNGALSLKHEAGSRFLMALGLGALSTWDELVQPFLSHADTSIKKETPYYDPGFWVNRLPYQSAQTRRVYLKIKRLMDLTAVILTMPLTLLLGLTLAFLIWLEDRAAPIYVQQRIGLGGRQFKMYKFRSMIPNADRRLTELGVRVNERGETINENGDKLENDPRITRMGRILRKTSLDELPQLWNVLLGQMSLVGPRPTSFGVDSYSLLQTQRLSVKPGITGLWQIYDRGDTDFDKRLIWDIKYIEKMSLSLDIEILLRTVLKFTNGAR